MVEGSKDSISIYINEIKQAVDVAVCLSFDASIASCCLERLKNSGNKGCNCIPTNIDETAICWSMYCGINMALCGNPNVSMSTTVTSTLCGSSGGKFSVSWKCKGNITTVRKTIAFAIKMLTPSKTYSIYSKVIKDGLCGKPNRESFNEASNNIMNSLEKSVVIGVVGKIKADKDSISNMLEVIDKKVNFGDKLIPAKKRQSEEPCKTECVFVSARGIDSYLGYQFISAFSKGVPICICEKGLCIYMKASQWDTLKSKLKEKIPNYVDKSFAKAQHKEIMGEILTRIAFDNCLISAQDGKALSKIDSLSDIKKSLEAIVK